MKRTEAQIIVNHLKNLLNRLGITIYESDGISLFRTQNRNYIVYLIHDNFQIPCIFDEIDLYGTRNGMSELIYKIKKAANLLFCMILLGK